MNARHHGLIIVNPNATTTNPRVRSVILHALHDQLDLDVVTTERAGHAGELARRAVEEDMEVVVTLGGDGTINEVLNGMLRTGRRGDELPALACVPGGSANVFTRSLGIANDPVEATGQILDSLAAGHIRTVNLGHASFVRPDSDGEAEERYFSINAGVGLDAEIVRAMEELRAAGKTASPTRYLMTTLREFLAETDRKEAALTISRPGAADVDGVFLAIVQNTSPWTYLGALPVNPCPSASFETGLDIFGPRSLSVFSGLRYGGRMLRSSRAGGTRTLLQLHDVSEFTITASRPSALQLDGEGLGDVEAVTMRSVPDALRAVTDPGV